MLEVFLFYFFKPPQLFSATFKFAVSKKPVDRVQVVLFFLNTLQYYQLFCSCARNVGFCPHVHNCFCCFFLRLFQIFFVIFVISGKNVKS